MKTIIGVLFFIMAINAVAQSKKSTLNNQEVEAACGQCQFGLKSKKGCDLAVKIEGKSYFVTGAKIDDYGDAHASDGFCSAVRKATVSGTITKDIFIATAFTVVLTKK